MEKIGRDVLGKVSRYSKIQHERSRVLPQLNDYESKEKEMACEAFKKIITYVSKNHMPKVQDIFRVLYEDKFQYRNPMAFVVASPWAVPVKLLLPFYEQVCINIPPCRTEREFIKIFGLTPLQVASLYKRGRVLPVLRCKPTSYREFMNVLLEEEPPSEELRWKYFMDSLEEAGIVNITDNIKEAHKIFCRLATDAVLSSWKIHDLSLFLRENRTTLDGLFYSFLTLYCELKLVGFKTLVKAITESFDLKTCVEFLATYWNFLAEPSIRGLGGSLQIDKISLMWADTFGVKISQKCVFPYEVGQFLTEFYDLTFPTDLEMDIVDKLYREKVMVKARELLERLDEAVQQGKCGEAIEKGRYLKRVFKEACEILPTLDKRLEKCRWMLSAVAYGAIGVLGMLTSPAIGLLAGIGYKVAEKNLFDHLALKITEIGINPLTTAVWHFQRSYKNVEDLKKNWKKLKKWTSELSIKENRLSNMCMQTD